jgi:hypothetical protein
LPALFILERSRGWKTKTTPLRAGFKPRRRVYLESNDGAGKNRRGAG